MKKSRAETSGALSGEFADRVRPPYASDEKRRQAAELFEHGIGYQRASRILDLPANTLRDWARAWHEIAEATGVGASTCKRWMDKLRKSEAQISSEF